jgi:hypothetical protein
MKLTLLLAAGLIMVASLLAVGCASSEEEEPTPPAVTQEESRIIAEEYIRSSPTFEFDGIPDSIELVAVHPADCPSCWGFVFEFDCRHAGYGDRTGQALAQVITPHTARIMVMGGEVLSAMLDDTWDMTEQRIVPGG